MKALDRNYKEPDFINVIEETDDDEFSIGQPSDNAPASKIKCKKCGSTEFIVGTGKYYTAIKCPVCRYEVCIHSG